MKLVKQALAWFKPVDSTPLHRNYVISQTFSDTSNCFDAEAIWGRPRMVVGDPRLRSLLNEYRFVVGGATQVFDKVIVELPAMNVEHDRRISRGAQTNCMNLAHELAELHQEAFGRLLPEGDSPRYVVVPAIDLQDDQVRVRFGHGVYIPEESEPRLWQIETSRDGTIFPKHEGNIALPARQHLCVLGGLHDAVSLTCPGWPFSEHVSLVIVNDPTQEKLSITAEPLGALSIRHDERLNSYIIGLPNSIQPSPDAPVYYVRTTRLTRFQQKAEQTDPMPAVIRKRVPVELTQPENSPRDAIKIDRAEPTLGEASTPFPVNTGAQKMSYGTQAKQGRDSSLTMLPCAYHSPPQKNDGTWLVPKTLVRGGKLHLSGIALQRPSAYRSYGITALNIGFDANGQVVPPQSDAWQIRISIDSDDAVEIETRQGRRPLAAGETIPIPLTGQCAIQFDKLPDTLSDRYIGCLRIPEKVSQDLIDGSEFIVSRDAARSNFSRIQALNGNGFISATKDPGGDCMGVSSKQCSLRLDGDNLHIVVDGQAPVIVLDPDIVTVTPVEQGAAHDLTHQQHLLVGHYLWRFERLPKVNGIAKIPQ